LVVVSSSTLALGVVMVILISNIYI
jgi:hypothetical protein